ncbi:uroporphyrinogen-III C-methyltransferase [Alteromonas abrolhosensis]|uniref:uroporphyrinogen-III C-methyltransferase n=1 Tax=Alteromonas abrolhosensis TaxID=1892904 RepID=UPI00096BA7E7|nr:uroporphyrinogen-III C-methyltransferase [Alteromonas abrolhosensis]
MSIATSWSFPFLRTLFKPQKPLLNLFYRDAISTTVTTVTTRQRLDDSKTSAKHSYFGKWLKLANRQNEGHKQGQVFIVGAGPGDAELLTLKALRLLQQADIVLFDALVSEDILALIPSKVVKEYVGKRCKKHSFTQDAICKRVVELASNGHTVVRLKGGDPALFARTCEETDALTKANIPFAIVPGITAASGVSAYTGIPLTDRRCAQSVSFMTAHFKNAEQWPEMAPMAQNVMNQTMVVYMGLSRLEGLCKGLVHHNVPSTWPVAAIENATSPEQRVITGVLADIHSKVEAANLTGPTLLIFGKVVESRQQVNTLLLHSSKYAATI